MNTLRRELQREIILEGVHRVRTKEEDPPTGRPVMRTLSSRKRRKTCREFHQGTIGV